MFQIEWKKSAVKELGKLDKSVSSRIYKDVESLKDNLYSKDVKRLRASNDFRLRLGDYRIIFSIDGNIINVLKVGHRKNIYR